MENVAVDQGAELCSVLVRVALTMDNTHLLNERALASLSRACTQSGNTFSTVSTDMETKGLQSTWHNDDERRGH